MDMYRAFLAILISFVILIGYQYFFIGPIQQEQTENATEQPATQQTQQSAEQPQISAAPAQPQASAPVQPVVQQPAVADQRAAREMTIDTDFYTVKLSEKGGVVTSFTLKNYRETKDEGAPGVNLVQTDANQGYPLSFTWSGIVDHNTLYTFDADEAVFDEAAGSATVTMRATSSAGLEVIRTYIFKNDDYLIDHQVTVANKSGQVLQGSAGLHQKTLPCGGLNKASNWLFRGPALYSEEGGLQDTKLKEFEDGPLTV